MAKYSKKAGEKVEQAMKEMKKGKLRSGRSGKKVTNPKQAIAIGLSEAREEGGKVPKKAAPKKAARKSASSSKTSTRSVSSTSRKKSAPRKTATGRTKGSSK